MVMVKSQHTPKKIENIIHVPQINSFFFSIFKKLNGWSWRTTTAVGKKMAKKAGHGTVYNWTNEPQANLPQIPLKPGVFLASKPHN